MVKKFKWTHLRNCTVLLMLCHSNVTHAIDIHSDLGFSLNASKRLLQHATNASHLWSKQMNGAISDLSISKNGKAIVVATSPDSDIEGTAKHYLLSRYGFNGQLVWQLKQTSPIKEVAISEDGAFTFVSNYENQLFALNAAGKTLWTTEGMCKPVISNVSKKIICYHDDDNEPKIGFDLFDWKGNKISSFGITKDILALKISSNEKNLVLGLTEGGVVLFSPEFIPLWQKTVPGEIVDIAVSSETAPVTAILYRDRAKPENEKIAILNSVGEQINVLSPSVKSSQLEISPDGSAVFYYSNSAHGQYLGSLSVLSSKELWKRGGSTPAEYSSSMSVTPTQVFEGFQENSVGERRIHILSFNYKGQLTKDIGLTLEQSAYLYSHKVALDSSLLLVGTDDGKVSVYHY